MRQTTLPQSGTPEWLFYWLHQQSYTSIQYMNFVEIFGVSLDLSTIYLLVLGGAELPLCAVVTPLENAIGESTM